MIAITQQEHPRKERKENADRRRRQLLDATRRSISAKGLKRTTLKTVAAEAGLSRSIAGFYFKSKDGLLTETLRDLHHTYERHWTAALDKAGNDLIARLVALVRADFDPSVYNPDFIFSWYALWGEKQFLELRDDEELNAFDLRRQQACKDILNGLLSGEPERANDLSVLLEALLDGFWHEAHLNAETADREKLLGTVLRFLTTYLPEHRDAIISQAE